jgi:hypothetical protein
MPTSDAHDNSINEQVQRRGRLASDARPASCVGRSRGAPTSRVSGAKRPRAMRSQ